MLIHKEAFADFDSDGSRRANIEQIQGTGAHLGLAVLVVTAAMQRDCVDATRRKLRSNVGIDLCISVVGEY